MKLDRRSLLKIAAAASLTAGLTDLNRGLSALAPKSSDEVASHAVEGRDGHFVLDGPWLLQSGKDLTSAGAEITGPNFSPDGWMPAIVPGTVLRSYVKAGKYPEPHYDLNNKFSENIIPDASVTGSDFTYPHWYRTTFTIATSIDGRTVWLDFNGINYRAGVYLNGVQAGTMAGMFKRGMFDVTKHAKIGLNTLAIQIFPLDFPGVPRGCGGDGQIGKNAATMYASIGWDFTFIDGVRDRNMGIYRTVEIIETGPVRIRDPFMITDSIPSPGKTNAAELRFKTTLVNSSSSTVSGVLSVMIDAAANRIVAVKQSITLLPNETRDIELLSSDHPSLVIQQPRLWQPVPLGKPELYPLDIEFNTDDGKRSDIIHTSFGVRTIVRDISFHGQNTFWVNGRRTFIQGGNWTVDAMLRGTTKSYEAQIRQMADAGINMFRSSCAGAPESDGFFDLCDKYGIMVWLEGGGAGQVYGPTDPQMQVDNWGDVVLRVRNHASLAYYCGSNEGGSVTGMAEITAKNDETRQYQNSSQDNGQRGCPYRYLGTNTLYDYTAKDLYGSGPLGPFGGFCNETGTPGLPPAEVLINMIPVTNLWPTKNNAGFDESIAYHDGGGFHDVRSFINNGCAEFGAFDQPDLGGRTGIENYAFKGQILGAMNFRAMSEVWKRNKWDESHGRFDSGYMLWTANNPVPMTAARLTNYTGEPNAALFYFAHGNKPVHAQYDYYYNDVSLINDTYEPIAALKVKAEIRNLDWSVKWSVEKVTGVQPDTSLEGVILLPPKDTQGFDKVHFIVVKLFDIAGKQIDSALYWRSAGDPKYGADGPFDQLNTMPFAQLKLKSKTIKAAGRETVTVWLSNPTKALAFFTRLKIYRSRSQRLVEPVHYSDNYFSLEPGEARTVTLDYDSADLGEESPVLTVEGWNLKTASFAFNKSGITPAADNTILYSPVRTPISTGKPVTVSSVESDSYPGSNVDDGDPATRWASQIGADPQWITIDLEKSQSLDKVTLNWQEAAARDYQIQVSADNANWTTLKNITGNELSGPVTFAGLNGHGRYVRVYCTARVTQWGYSLFEVEVYSK